MFKYVHESGLLKKPIQHKKFVSHRGLVDVLQHGNPKTFRNAMRNQFENHFQRLFYSHYASVLFLTFSLTVCASPISSLPTAQTILAGGSQPATSVIETTVFQNGQDGYRCYRIPAIVKASNGELMAFAEGRITDCGDFGDVDIVLRRSADGGKIWSAVQRVADFGANQAGNPAPVFDMTDSRYPNGRLFLLYNTGTASEADVRAGKAVREVWYITSTDNGQSWSTPVNITTQVSRPNRPEINAAYAFKEDWRSYANTPGHALQLASGPHKGRLFVAANHSAGPPQPQFRDYRAHGFYSDDHGQTWKLSADVSYPGSNESTAAETPGGGLLMNIRNQSGDVKNRLLAFSANAGETWDRVVVASDLPDPVCQGSLINYPSATSPPTLLFSNANSQTKREKLTLRLSQDGGKSWSSGKEIYAGPAAYSDLVVQQDGQIGVLYEKDGYVKIVYARIPYDELTR